VLVVYRLLLIATNNQQRTTNDERASPKPPSYPKRLTSVRIGSDRNLLSGAVLVFSSPVVGAKPEDENHDQEQV
jgi:hypothetical protein